MGARLHKDAATGMTEAQLEKSEVEFRKTIGGDSNTVAAVREDAQFIAEATGGNVDTIEKSLRKLYKPVADAPTMLERTPEGDDPFDWDALDC